MIILGTHCGHNSSAALMIDGRIVGALQEERFTKVKNQSAFPARAIGHLIDSHLDGDATRIDRVAHGTLDVDAVGLALTRFSTFSVQDHVRENHAYWWPVFYEGAANDASYWREMYRRGEHVNQNQNIDTGYMLSDMSVAEMVRHVSDVLRPEAMERLFGYRGPNLFLDHHSCHGYYALHGEPVAAERLAKTVVLSADSWGDGCNWGAWVPGAGGRLEKVGGGNDHGVARIYRNVTLIMGMKPNEHEYKVMGLSGYSRPSKYVEEVEAVFSEMLDFRDGRFVRDKPLKDSYFDIKERLEGLRFDNIASGLQNWSTRVTAAWVRHWLKETGASGLCYSGGLSMNIKANGDLLDMPELEWMNVPASGGDESQSIGACFMAAAEADQSIEPVHSVYLGAIDGRVGDEDDWAEGVRRAGGDPADYVVRDGVGAAEIARLLAANVIVARCAGPMEFGARALGNRSILASPSDVKNVKRINDAIKNRDFWMPFTPSILEEKTDRYLDNAKHAVSPYMTIGFRTTEAAQREIPAALHPGDYTARPQFVSRQTNSEYWEIISEFEKITGVPAVLNTSLNLHGDPMNCTVADAARTLALSALDCLALPGDRLLSKKAAESEIAPCIS